ncbi:MAG: CPBP family glutamic-type intramembrane protease [Clostridia bacterium]|nr:CPBP family glutamic-type intramembrane protease [Clostridia bacterium]
MELNSNNKRPKNTGSGSHSEIDRLLNVPDPGEEKKETPKAPENIGKNDSAGSKQSAEKDPSGEKPSKERAPSGEKPSAARAPFAGKPSNERKDPAPAAVPLGDGKKKALRSTEGKNRSNSKPDVFSPIKKLFSGIADEPDGNVSNYRRQIAAPLLVLAVFALLRLSGVIDMRLTRENEYAAVIMLQVLIFLVPAAVYLAVTKNTVGLRLRPFGIGHLLLILSAILMIQSGSILLNCLFGGYETISQSYDLYGIFISKNDGSLSDGLYLVLAYALLPAFCEEFVFRAILCREYERRSTFAAIFMPAFFFAMLHFDLSRFPAFFFAGLVLALTMYSSRSILASVAVHFGCNMIALFFRNYIVTIYDLGGNSLFVFIMTVIFLLFGFIFFAEAARLYRNYASGGYSDSYREMLPPPVSGTETANGRSDPAQVFASRHPRIAASLAALISPTALLCYLFYTVFILLF